MAEDNIKTLEIKEIATTNDGRDITRGFVDGFPLLQTQDKLLLLKSAGDLKIYQEVLRDDAVKTCLGQRFSAVTRCNWTVKPGGTKLIDKKAAEFISEQLNNLEFDQITEKMLYGVFYGYAVAEAIYKPEGNRIVLADIKVRNRVRFGYAPDMSLRLKTMNKPMGEILPDRKFWQFCTGADHDDEPYGLGLAHWLYWPVFFKRSGIKFWLKFLDKFGNPTAHGTYGPGVLEADQEKLLQALRDIQNDSAVITPEGTTITLLEAARSGAADYASMVKVMDDAIAKVILGQTASTQGTPGKLGNDDVQDDVRKDIVKADADVVCMSFSASVARWLTDWNFPGAAYPTIWRQVEEPEDTDHTASRDSKIKGMGYKPKLAYIKETYGDHWEEAAPTNDNPVEPEKVPGSDASFAEPVESATGQLENDLTKHAADHWDKTVKKLQDLVAKATDLTILQDQLITEFAALDSDTLVNVMATGFALAELKGLSDERENAA